MCESVLFEQKEIRRIWDKRAEKWWFSVVDVVEVLAENDRPRKYWNDLKKKLQDEGNELSEKIGRLKLLATDGKMRLTDVADTEQLLRIIQSISSPKAELFKMWLAQCSSISFSFVYRTLDRTITSYELNLAPHSLKNQAP